MTINPLKAKYLTSRNGLIFSSGNLGSMVQNHNNINMYSDSHIRILGFKVKLKLFSLKFQNYSADIWSGFEQQHTRFSSNSDVAISRIAGQCHISNLSLLKSTWRQLPVLANCKEFSANINPQSGIFSIFWRWMGNYLPKKLKVGTFMRALILKTTFQLFLSLCNYYNFIYSPYRSIYLYVLAQKLHCFASNRRSLSS